MIRTTSNIKVDPIPDDWEAPVIHKAEIMDAGLKIGLLVRNRDGSLEAIRLTVGEIMRL